MILSLDKLDKCRLDEAHCKASRLSKRHRGEFLVFRASEGEYSYLGVHSREEHIVYILTPEVSHEVLGRYRRGKRTS